MYALLRHVSASKLQVSANALSAEIARVYLGMKSRENASGLTRDLIAPFRSVEITPDDLHQLWQDSKGSCALCGRPIQLSTANRLLQMSPDRLDNGNGGYTRSNTRLTHVGCNLGRNVASLEDAKEWLSCIRGEV